MGRFGLKEVVHRIAVHFGGAAGAPCLAIDASEPGLGGLFVSRAAGDENRAIDEGELVVFLEEDNNAILQLNAFGLLRLEVVEFWDGDLFPGLRLLGGESLGRDE